MSPVYGLLKDQQNAWGDQDGDACDAVSAREEMHNVMCENGDGAESTHMTEFGWGTGRSNTTPR